MLDVLRNISGNLVLLHWQRTNSSSELFFGNPQPDINVSWWEWFKSSFYFSHANLSLVQHKFTVMCYTSQTEKKVGRKEQNWRTLEIWLIALAGEITLYMSWIVRLAFYVFTVSKKVSRGTNFKSTYSTKTLILCFVGIILILTTNGITSVNAIQYSQFRFRWWSSTVRGSFPKQLLWELTVRVQLQPKLYRLSLL